MTREEAVEVLKERYLTCVGIGLDNHANRVNEAIDMAIETLSAEPIQTRNCDGCDIFTMAEELAKASIDACADEIVRQVKDSRVECKDCLLTKERDEYTNKIWCCRHREYMDDMYYCADGLRREDGEA